MPTYDYLCDSCKHRFEIFQSIKASPLRKCPKCGKRKVRRLLGTGGGILFKGSGFYQTDYRSKNYQEAAKKEGGSSKSPSAETSKQPPAEKKKEAPEPQKSKEEK